MDLFYGVVMQLQYFYIPDRSNCIDSSASTFDDLFKQMQFGDVSLRLPCYSHIVSVSAATEDLVCGGTGPMRNSRQRVLNGAGRENKLEELLMNAMHLGFFLDILAVYF